MVVGGAREVLCQEKDKIDLVILKRKGFIKKALEHGSDLVPTFSFGETFIFDAMWPNPKGSWTRKFQEYVLIVFGLPIFFFYGIGPLPKRHPITVVGMLKKGLIPHIFAYLRGHSITT